MSLEKTLRKAGYDWIDSPNREHELLQLWRKKNLDKPEPYKGLITDVFDSRVPLEVKEDASLNVDSSSKKEFGFDIGLDALKSVLEPVGLGNLDVSVAVKTGKSVSISYDDSITKVVHIGDIEDFLSVAKLKIPNSSFLADLNRDNILVICGVLYAKNLVVEIETDFSLDASVEGKLNAAVDGKLGVDISTENRLKMTASSDEYFPIAVRANRIDFDNDVFSKTKLITDNRKFF